jgi:hypothetical protein
MLEKIAMLDSTVLRALLVAFAGLVGAVLRAFGVGSDLFEKAVMDIIDQVMLCLTAVAVLYAAYARITKPNPPLSDKAVVDTQRLVDEGKLTPISGGEEKE